MEAAELCVWEGWEFNVQVILFGSCVVGGVVGRGAAGDVVVLTVAEEIFCGRELIGRMMVGRGGGRILGGVCGVVMGVRESEYVVVTGVCILEGGGVWVMQSGRWMGVFVE